MNLEMKHHIQIIGVPIDLGASRRGTDGGPSALRMVGLSQKLIKLGYSVVLEKDIIVPSMETRVTDEINPGYKKEIMEVCIELASTVEKALERGHFPLVLGGDHSVAMGSVSAVSHHFLKKNEPIGLLWLDAHGDMNTPATSSSGNIHGMPLAHLLGDGDPDLAGIMGFKGKVSAESVALVGVRKFDDKERNRVRNAGIHIFTMRDIDERGIAQVTREALEVVSRNTIGYHLSFDVDVCDPSVIPGCGTLVPGGLNFREAHLLLELCADNRNMLAMDIVELNPFVDKANISAERTVGLIQSALGKTII